MNVEFSKVFSLFLFTGEMLWTSPMRAVVLVAVELVLAWTLESPVTTGLEFVLTKEIDEVPTTAPELVLVTALELALTAGLKLAELTESVQAVLSTYSLHLPFFFLIADMICKKKYTNRNDNGDK